MQPRFALVTHPLALASGEENLSPGLLRCRRKIIVQDLVLSTAWERSGETRAFRIFSFEKRRSIRVEKTSLALQKNLRATRRGRYG